MQEEQPGNTSSIRPEEWGPGYRAWQAFLSLLAQRGPEGTTSLVRMASHLVLIAVAVLVLWFSRVQLPEWEIVEVEEAEAPTEEIAVVPSTFENGTETVETDAETVETAALVREAVPFTLIPKRPRVDVITHTVVAGDTLYALAQKYNIGAETLMWANNMEQNPDLLRLGQQLIVLPVNGVLHTVKTKDTLESIAKQYKAKVADIVSYKGNGLNQRNPALKEGQRLIVPGGSKPIPQRTVRIYTGSVPANASRGTGRFVWPTSGRITQGYKRLHPALDIAGRTGMQVKAADSGFVVVAGWSNAGYGNYIVIDHRNGYQTLYAHLSRMYVNAGESVGKGAVIGAMGTTGRSTGPHLHFEIHQRGIARNPFSFLP